MFVDSSKREIFPVHERGPKRGLNDSKHGSELIEWPSVIAELSYRNVILNIDLMPKNHVPNVPLMVNSMTKRSPEYDIKCISAPIPTQRSP